MTENDLKKKSNKKDRPTERQSGVQSRVHATKNERLSLNLCGTGREQESGGAREHCSKAAGYFVGGKGKYKQEREMTIKEKKKEKKR